MKKFSFYWNWLARVAKASNTQRKVVVKSATPTKSPIIGKTAFFVVATIIAVALTTQTTGTSAEIPELPDLPPPPPQREVVLPPFPPGAFSNCIEQYYSRLGTIAQGASDWRKRIEEKFDALLDPIDALIDAKRKLIDDLTTKIRRIYSSLEYSLAYIGLADMEPIEKEIKRLMEALKAAQARFLNLYRERSSILECYDKWIDWLNEKTQREVNAAWEEYENCAASETNDN